uniref:Uncharacterized protein n=1 Tax=Timema poppense TaxID=170557 RepID=A0A7R9H3I4_TIMPO|nr:unnamed protein product [Timema poppensis]
MKEDVPTDPQRWKRRIMMTRAWSMVIGSEVASAPAPNLRYQKKPIELHFVFGGSLSDMFIRNIGVWSGLPVMAMSGIKSHPVLKDNSFHGLSVTCTIKVHIKLILACRGYLTSLANKPGNKQQIII